MDVTIEYRLKLHNKILGMDCTSNNNKKIKEAYKILYPYSSVPKKVKGVFDLILHILSMDKIPEHLEGRIPKFIEYLEKI